MARNKHPEETVKLIIDEAAKLFMQKGYDKTSLQDIINETGLSKGAIYHHFVSKEDIFENICMRIGEGNEARLKKVRDAGDMNGYEKLKMIFKVAMLHESQEKILKMAPYLLDNPRFLAVQIRSMYDEVAPDYIKPILDEGVADGSIKVEDTKELAEAIMILTNVWLNPILKPTDAETMRARFKVFVKLMNGIGLDLLDNELIEGYCNYSKILSDSHREER